MSVFKKYQGKRITPEDPNWEKGTWYVWRRVNGAVIHKGLKYVESAEEAMEIERLMIREVLSETSIRTRRAASSVKRAIRTEVRDGVEFVYIFESAGYFKIGRTNDIAKRLATISKTIIPFETHPIMTVMVANAAEIERTLHQEFALYRNRGEWFVFTSETLGKVKRRLVQLSEKQSFYV